MKKNVDETEEKKVPESQDSDFLSIPEPAPVKLPEKIKPIPIPNLRMELWLSGGPGIGGFQLKEFCVSAQHPDVAAKMVVTDQAQINLGHLCVNILQPLRDFMKKSIGINSGLRDKMLNGLCNGAENSDHLYGNAADTNLRGADGWKAFVYLAQNKRIVVGQAILYFKAGNIGNPLWLHVSNPTSKHRGEFLIKFEGNPKYYKYGKDRIPGIHP